MASYRSQIKFRAHWSSKAEFVYLFNALLTTPHRFDPDPFHRDAETLDTKLHDYAFDASCHSLK
jgi:hypothetical protein